MVEAPWLDEARKHIGTSEVPGVSDNPKIMQWFADAGASWPEHDEVPWCAGFVGAMLENTGFKGSGSLMARSYLAVGMKLDRPQPGCIAIFPRGKPPAGHVAFVEEVDLSRGTMTTIDGNVSNKVKRVKRKIDSALGFRWPEPKVVEVPPPPEPHPARDHVGPAQTPKDLVKRSRKWTIAAWLKWMFGALGLGGLSIDLGTASGVQEFSSYANGIKGLVSNFGIFGLVLMCALVVIAATFIQRAVQEDVDEARYTPRGGA